MFIIDFGTDMTEQEAALYEMPFEYARSTFGLCGRRITVSVTRKNGGFTGEPRPDMRAAQGRPEEVHHHAASLQASAVRLADGRHSRRFSDI